VKRITMRLACASILTALVLSGCAGGGNGYDDRIGAYGTGYGSNGNRLFERDDEDRPARRGDAGHADRGKEMNKTQTAENGGRSGMFGTEDEFNGSRDGGGAGWFGAGTFSGRTATSSMIPETSASATDTTASPPTAPARPTPKARPSARETEEVSSFNSAASGLRAGIRLPQGKPETAAGCCG